MAKTREKDLGPIVAALCILHLVVVESACPTGSYQEKDGTCVRCSRINNPFYERVLVECTDTQDTQIGCVEGFYRPPPSFAHERGVCLRCQRCNETHPYQIRACKVDKDTLCCPGLNYDVQEGTDGVDKCRINCGLGEYLDTHTNTCKPCRDNTFMDQDKHHNEGCIPCQKPVFPQVLTKSCTRSQPTGIDCREGYYQSTFQSKYNPHCYPCRFCQFNETHKHTGLACSATHDTVCCEAPDMIVVDTPNGFVCQHRPSTPPTSGPAIVATSPSPPPSSKTPETTSTDQYSGSITNQPQTVIPGTPGQDDFAITPTGLFSLVVSVISLIAVPCLLIIFGAYGNQAQ